jgi:formylglycine-generating enzyme required for sulfatase activity
LVYVNWREASAFARSLSNLTGRKFRLPTYSEIRYGASFLLSKNLFIWTGTKGQCSHTFVIMRRAVESYLVDDESYPMSRYADVSFYLVEEIDVLTKVF